MSRAGLPTMCAALLVALSIHASLAQAEDAGVPARPPAVFERDAVEVQAPAGASFQRVRIDNHFGNVSVRGHDHPSIAIQSFKRADDEATLDRLVVSLVPDGKGQVAISTALRAGAEYKPVRSGGIAVDLVVFVPRASAVDAEIWNGQLLVSKIDNGATLSADEGRIEVKQVSGVVEADMRHGEQAFAELFGELYARGIEGSLDMNAVSGKRLEANLVRGRIAGTGLKVANMKIRSVFGDVDLSSEFAAGGSYRISSRKGNVSIRFHGRAPVGLKVLALKAMLATELEPSADGEKRWLAHFGARTAKAVPANLEISAPAGTVVVRHF